MIRDNGGWQGGKVGILFRNESRSRVFPPDRNRVESNRISDSGGEDGPAIDVQGRARDLRIIRNLLRETRSPSRRAGVRTAPEAGTIFLADNRCERFSTDVDRTDTQNPARWPTWRSRHPAIDASSSRRC